jgi:hypothetical protein
VKYRNKTPGWLLALAGALWALGAALAIIGWQGDRHGFWEDKGFLVNLFSSLTSACFGIPLAVIILTRVSLSQANTFQRRRVWHQFVVVFNDMKTTAWYPVHHLFEETAHLNVRAGEVRRLSDRECEQVIKIAAEHLSRMGQSRRSLVDSWEFFYSDIRIRLLDVGYSYPRFPMMELGERIRQLKMPRVAEWRLPLTLGVLTKRARLRGMIEQYTSMDNEMKEIYHLMLGLFDSIVADNNNGAGPTRFSYSGGGSGGL